MSRVALVTGGTRGIGHAISVELKNAGFDVAATYAGNDEAAKKFTDETGIKTYKWDVGDYDACVEGLKKVEADHGPIDTVVNNAGITRDAMLHKLTPQMWREVMSADLDSMFNMCQPLISGMRDRGFGRIVNISSMTGLVANPPNGYYSSTKFALEALTEALAQEVKPFGIKVTAIEPGAFRTDWAARSMWESATPIGDYDDTVGSRKTMIKEFANHLPGDPRKAADAVLMVTGLDDPPLRLLLGRDVLKAVRDKLAAFSASIDEWAPVTKDVEFPRS